MSYLKRLLAVFVCTLAVSCGGGGGGATMDTPPTPTGPTNSGTPTATGDPSNGDFVEIGAQLSSMAADQIVQALSGATASAQLASGALDLRAPSQSISRTAAFFCCGPQSSNKSYITVATNITVTPGTGVLGILQSFGSFTETEWSSTVANGWRIDLSKLRITSELATTGSTVNASQQLRLSGTLTYTLPNQIVKSADVDVTFRYADLVSSTPTSTGQIGTATLTGQSTPPLVSPGRCSRPREGCGATASGDAPCTVWPRCPGT